MLPPMNWIGSPHTLGVSKTLTSYLPWCLTMAGTTTFTLDSVESYISDARTILLDRTPPYRYSDETLLVAFNTALLEARRLRPDMFVYKFGDRMPSFGAVSSEPVPIEPQLRLPVVYGLVAHAMLRDEEDVPVERANAFLAKFQNMLVGIFAAPAAPTTPAPRQQ